jgi:ABC-2 type transport system permease protein
MASYYGPAMALFLLFFNVAVGTRSLIVESETGTLTRITTAPVAPRTVLYGKALAMFGVGLTSLTVTSVAMRVLLNAHSGDIGGFLLLSAAAVAAAIGVMALVTTFADTERQAAQLTALTVFLLALLSGNFLPPDRFPSLLRWISMATPSRWALSGYLALASGRATVTTIVPIVLVMGGAAAVTIAISVMRLERRFTPVWAR